MIPDQNRNKAPRTSAAGGVSALKRPHQPDLVTNSIGNAHAAQEISRLEALCESRTKELNLVKLQLRQGAVGMEATLVLVKYLTQEVSHWSLRQGAVSHSVIEAGDHESLSQ